MIKGRGVSCLRFDVPKRYCRRNSAARRLPSCASRKMLRMSARPLGTGDFGVDEMAKRSDLGVGFAPSAGAAHPP